MLYILSLSNTNQRSLLLREQHHNAFAHQAISFDWFLVLLIIHTIKISHKSNVFFFSSSTNSSYRRHTIALFTCPTSKFIFWSDSFQNTFFFIAAFLNLFWKQNKWESYLKKKRFKKNPKWKCELGNYSHFCLPFVSLTEFHDTLVV